MDIGSGIGVVVAPNKPVLQLPGKGLGTEAGFGFLCPCLGCAEDLRAELGKLSFDETHDPAVRGCVGRRDENLLDEIFGDRVGGGLRLLGKMPERQEGNGRRA